MAVACGRRSSALPSPPRLRWRQWSVLPQEQYSRLAVVEAKTMDVEQWKQLVERTLEQTTDVEMDWDDEITVEHFLAELDGSGRRLILAALPDGDAILRQLDLLSAPRLSADSREVQSAVKQTVDDVFDYEEELQGESDGEPIILEVSGVVPPGATHLLQIETGSAWSAWIEEDPRYGPFLPLIQAPLDVILQYRMSSLWFVFIPWLEAVGAFEHGRSPLRTYDLVRRAGLDIGRERDYSNRVIVYPDHR